MVLGSEKLRVRISTGWRWLRTPEILDVNPYLGLCMVCVPSGDLNGLRCFWFFEPE